MAIDLPLPSAAQTAGVFRLEDIRRPVEGELREFEHYFREAMRSRVRLLDLVTQYVLRTKGKLVRPLLVMLSAKACGGITRSTFSAGALVELLHTATLVHDDVVDDALLRRGLFSIQALWKRKVAVLFGDFLLARGLLLALENKDYALLHIVSDAVRRMSEGELLQLEKTRHLDIDEPTYFRIISDKTASLLSACTATGAASAGADEEVVARMKDFGEALGLAFQIRDDLFDYGVADVGKPVGLDVQDKKLTLPLIHALERASGEERRRILRIVGKKRKSKEDLRAVAEFAEQNGGISYAKERMFAYADQARAYLDVLPESPARDALDRLVWFVVNRTK